MTVLFFFLHLPQNVYVNIDPTQFRPQTSDLRGWGCGQGHWAPAQLSRLILTKPPKLFCSSAFSCCEMSITAHLPSLPFPARQRGGHTQHNEGLPVVFHKMQDFSLSNSLAIVQKVNGSQHAQTILPFNPGYFVLFAQQCFFASDCIKPVVNILMGEELIKM